MLSVKQILLYYSSPILAIVIGLSVVKKLNHFFRLSLFRIILMLLASYVLIEVITFSSIWVNIFMAADTLFLFLMAQTYFNSTKSKFLLRVLYSSFLIIYILDIFVLGTRVYVYHAVIVKDFMITGIYLKVLHDEFMKTIGKLPNTATIIISIGIVTYFSIIIPNESLIPCYGRGGIITSSCLELSEIIYEILDNTLYILIAVSFIIASKTSIATYQSAS